MTEHDSELLYVWFWETIYDMSPHIQKGRAYAGKYLNEYR